jgi:sulfatase maturation enzyme AslB (radical SAM superfamily)
MEYCRDKGISTNLTTNATLINEETAQRLMSSGLYGINLSLDGLSGNHNYIRNRQDAYHKVRVATHNLLMHRKGPMPYVNLTAVITKQNLDDLSDLVHFIHSWGIDGVGFQALDHNFNAEYTKDWFKNNEFWPDDYNKVERALDNLIKIKLSGINIHNHAEQLRDFKKYYKDPTEGLKYRCRSGDNNFIVDESGGVRLCWNDDPVADILTCDPAVIWQSRIANQARNKISACIRTCRILNCNYSK